MEICEVNTVETRRSIMRQCGIAETDIQKELKTASAHKMLVLSSNDLINAYAIIDKQSNEVLKLQVAEFAKRFGCDRELAEHLKK